MVHTVNFDEIDFHPEYTLIIAADDEGQFMEQVTSEIGQTYIKITSDEMHDPPRIEYEVDMPAAWEVTVPYSPELEDWALQHAFIYFDGELLLRGKVYDVNTNDESSLTSIGGDGILDDLKHDGTRTVINHKPHSEAIENYVNDETDWDIDLRPDDVSLVDTDQISHRIVSQEDWEEAVGDIPDDLPLAVKNGGLEVLQSCWPVRGQFYDTGRSTVSDFRHDDAFVGGTAIALRTGPGVRDPEVFDNGGIDYAEFEFELEYTIPSDMFGCFVRHTSHPDNGIPQIEWKLIRLDEDGEHDRAWIFDKHDRAWDRRLEHRWQDLVRVGLSKDTYTGPDLTPGTYRVAVEVTDSYGSQDRHYIIDMVAPYDQRYIPRSSFRQHWDQVHEPEGHLDGPQLGGTVHIELEPFQSSYRITRARFESVWNDVGDDQAIRLSNDGETWRPIGSAARNTEAGGALLGDTYGTALSVRLTLNWSSRTGARQFRTPRFKYTAQRCESLRTYRWTDDLPVIDEMELTGNHYSNLSRLHQSGGRVFHALYDEHDKELISLVPGTVEEEMKDIIVIDHTRDISARGYANVVRVHGADGIHFTWFNPLEIERRGEHWHHVDEPDVTNHRSLRAIGRPILRERVEADELIGSIEIVPTIVTPGISYVSDYFDGKPMLLHRATFEDSESPSGSLDFKTPEELAEILKDLRNQIAGNR